MPSIMSEMWRVLRPGGTLILGTPDYSRRLWLMLEWIYGKVLPGAYAHEHITHYTNEGLDAKLRDSGFEILDCLYVGRCEMIFKARKPEMPVNADASCAVNQTVAVCAADDSRLLNQEATT
jgi:hypothetical protein